MPDISKINALAIGSVAKVDGLGKGCGFSIDGISTPAPALDPQAAYSVRLLGSGVGISSYTGACMRVRRASDNNEIDVGFDAGELKLTSPVSNPSTGGPFTDFADFVGHGGTPTDAFCRTWYDQSGNGYDAGQTTQSQQPQIYDATTGLIKEGSVGNEKPALYFTRSNKHILKGATFTAVSQPYTYIGVFQFDGASESAVLSSSLTNLIQVYGSSSGWRLYAGSVDFGGTRSTGVQYLAFGVFKSPNSALHVNNIEVSSVGNSGTNQTDSLSIGNASGYGGSFNWHEGPVQEAIFYPSCQSSNRSSIQTDINGFFSIY